MQTKDLFAWMNLHGVNVYVAGDWHEHKHWEKGGIAMMFPPTLYKAIEAKLKEKNT